MRRITKLFQTKALSVDDENKTITFKISDDLPDRMGERVDQDSWQLDNYNQNPIVLWGHNPDEPENVLGTTQEFTGGLKDKGGKYSTATIKFDTDINPKAQLVYNQAKRGTLRTTSIGFIPHTEEYQDDMPVLKDNELLEISVVPIPANPRAIALDYKAGAISRKDATWLMESMKNEADFLAKELENDNVNEEDPEMNEQLTKTLGTMMDAITTLATGQAETAKRLADLADAIEAKGTPMTNMPCAPEDTAWSGAEATKRVKEWASDSEGNINWRKYAKAFFWFDSSAPDPDEDGLPDRQGDYKLPFCDVIDGKLMAVWNGVKAAYAAMEGARGGVDMPDSDKAKVMAQIKKYYKKFGKDMPEDGKAFDLESDGVETKDLAHQDGVEAPTSPESAAETPAAPASDPAPETTAEPSPVAPESATEADKTPETPSEDAQVTEEAPASDDAAKGGDNDQPGAATDDDLDIDLDAELTPELQAQIDGAL